MTFNVKRERQMAAYSVTESGVLQGSSDEAANPRGVKLSEDNRLVKGKHIPSFNGRLNMATNLNQIGVKARKESRLVFTSLYHHVCDVDNLRACFHALKSGKATGLDIIRAMVRRGLPSIWSAAA